MQDRSDGQPAAGGGADPAWARRCWRVARGAVLITARLFFSLVGIAVLSIAVLYLRLLQGPLVLPGVAKMVSERVNAASDELRVAAADVVLTLGEDALSSGLQFRDVEVRSVDGQRLFAVPRLAARFNVSDLVQGRVQPVRITLVEPDLQVIRGPDGSLRYGLGPDSGVALGEAGADEGSDRSVGMLGGGDAFARLADGFVGDGAPIPALARLEEVAIVGANVVYDDRLGKGGWHTDHATLRLSRHDWGARALMEVEAARDGTQPASVRMVADRRRGAGRTDLRVQFGQLPAADLARQSRQLDWLALVGGTVEGDVEATLESDGDLSRLEGVVVAEDGVIRGVGRPMPFDVVQLRFRTEPALERLMIEDLRLSAAAMNASMHGYADLIRDADDDLVALAGQVDIGALFIDLPEVFADPIVFDGGRLTARWRLDAGQVEIVGGRLSRGDLAFAVEGRGRAVGDGWLADLRAEAEGMTVDDLVAYWPLAAAEGARSWIDENIPAGSIDRVVAQMRLGSDQPRLALDFDYSGVETEYVDGMSPIEAASGSGHVTYNDFFLAMDDGHVAPAEGGTLALAGSSLVISGFWGNVTPAEIALRAEGPTAAVLSLIDEPPLRLVSRLGKDLGQVAGRARVEADMVVPLIADLRLEDVQVAAQAVLTEVALPLTIEPGRTVKVEADRLDVSADTAALRLAGDARIDGVPLSVEWQENYGPGRDDRLLALAGAASPGLLAAAGAADLPVAGAPEFELTLRQSGGGPFGFTLDSDLKAAQVEIAALGWTKETGVPARLHAEGRLGDGLDIDTLRLDSPALDAEGKVQLSADGRLERAEFAQIRMAGLGSFSATVSPGPDGITDLRLTGRRLDVSDWIDGASGDGGSAGDPLRLSFDLAELRLSDKLALTPASGRIERGAAGGVIGRIDGTLGGNAPVIVRLDLPPGSEPGIVTVTSPDAGEALRAAGLYSNAQGGTLAVEVRTGTKASPGLSGRARIEDVVVFSQSTFRDVLRDGGLSEAEAEVSSGGLRFRQIMVPFTYRGDHVTLKDAIAVSPALAIKLNGTVNERTDQVDLVGVLSPAYVLTGALNEIPLIGEVLGGKGEGILAMTFRLRGDIEDPQFSVNPLSVLAPGFLRRLFTQPSSATHPDFRDRISRQGR